MRLGMRSMRQREGVAVKGVVVKWVGVKGRRVITC